MYSDAIMQPMQHAELCIRKRVMRDKVFRYAK